jgi:DNA-binding NarL/FixJ family response regulator
MPVHARDMALDFLIVDDDPAFREAAATLLADRGYRVVGEAGTVTAARAAILRLHPDAVLLDINLPDGDGFSLARELHDNGGPPVLLISTDPDIAPRRAVRECGAAGFIDKTRLYIADLAGYLEA